MIKRRKELNDLISSLKEQGYTIDELKLTKKGYTLKLGFTPQNADNPQTSEDSKQ